MYWSTELENPSRCVNRQYHPTTVYAWQYNTRSTTVVYNFSSDYARSSLHTVVRSKDDVNDIFIIICFCFRPSERQAPFSTAPYHLWLVQFREDRQDLDEQGDCGTLFKRKGNGILGCQLGWFAVTTAEMNDLFVEWMTEWACQGIYPLKEVRIPEPWLRE